MRKILQRTAAEMQRPDQVVSGAVWDDIRMFLACARHSSLRRAARQLHLSDSTVVRRIARLEEHLGVVLFDRLPEGIALTVEGRAILDSAEHMEHAAFDLLRTRSPAGGGKSRVSVSITEGLGSYWVMPQLVRFQRQHPTILVALHCGMESADVLRFEADMAVQLVQPQSPDLMVTRLGRLHIYPFASPAYLQTYGTPTSIADMAGHRLIKQVAPQLDDQVWARKLGIADTDQIASVSTNASTALLYAVENGAGVGGLPTYVAALNDRIVPVDLGGSYPIDIWLTFHPDVRRNENKAYLIEWLKRIFDARRYPWFADEFIHPKQFKKPRVHPFA